MAQIYFKKREHQLSGKKQFIYVQVIAFENDFNS